MDPIVKVAAKYPNVHFEHATGYKRAANLSTYATRSYEGNYIQGVIAATMSKTGVLGYVSSFPIPEGSPGSMPRCSARRPSIPTSGSRSSG